MPQRWESDQKKSRRLAVMDLDYLRDTFFHIFSEISWGVPSFSQYIYIYINFLINAYLQIYMYGIYTLWTCLTFPSPFFLNMHFPPRKKKNTCNIVAYDSVSSNRKLKFNSCVSLLKFFSGKKPPMDWPSLLRPTRSKGQRNMESQRQKKPGTSKLRRGLPGFLS